MQRQYQLIIFDWDGTLANSTQHIIQAMQQAATDCDLPPLAADAVQNIIGLGLEEAIHTLCPQLTDADFEAMRERYVHHFLQRPTTIDDLFDGALQLLDQLQGNAFQLAIATGKSRRGLNRVLRDTNLESYFLATRCADETRSKPHPLMLEELLEHFNCPAEAALMVGDTEYDMAMAQAVQMDRVAVDFGAHAVERLQAYAPLACLSNLRELYGLLGRIN